MGRLLILTAGLLAVLFAGLPVSAVPIKNQTLAKIPDYVMDYAPVVYLHSKEHFFPSDFATHLKHTTPEVNFKKLDGVPSPLTIDNLDALNDLSDKTVWLASNDNVEKDPVWLRGIRPNKQGKTEGGVTCAIVTVAHDDQKTLDAFYLYFYSYNLGPPVFFLHFGNHVGDWEYNTIRFVDGKPQSIFYSAHDNGDSYEWDAISRQGKRPISYAGLGTHANYADSGAHGDVVLDQTVKGIYWDPTLAAYQYAYNTTDKTFTAGDKGENPLGVVNYLGRWGDPQLRKSDKRQKQLFGLKLATKYVSGPQGPRDKNLNRKNICKKNDEDCNPWTNWSLLWSSP